MELRVFSTLLDADGDGVMAWNDCDDNDSSLSQSNDADCDGTLNTDDCDDNDPIQPSLPKMRTVMA